MKQKVCCSIKGRDAVMRKNRKSNTKKERVIMLASSAFVLAALTMTGIYMQSNNAESEDDGYTLDLAELQDSAENKVNEIAETNEDTAQENGGTVAQNDKGETGSELPGEAVAELKNSDDALDFMPLEAGSDLVEIPGLTDGEAEGTDMAAATDEAEAAVAEEAAAVDSKTVTQTLQFAEADGLLKPVSGEVMLPFSMDGSIYFSTLDQYKYNPALMLSAEIGTTVISCTDGKVVDIFENEEIGQAVTVELGDGYQLTYGQLADVTVAVGDYVEEGEVLAVVATPTKYFSVEGSNLYMKLTADGVPVNPELLFR